ncbi:MAG: sulfite exporter TauE/SafE family protein [Myxococcales bacterium]|nr:MAG: sulfite exporter TauE/SafE family protein [Myxococcales bacterium]
MESLFIAVGSAFWLGVLTSVSPCPLATNITAVSYIGKRLERPSRVLLAGMLYTAGRALTYSLVALLVVQSIFSIPAVSNFLQRYMNQLLGPVLVAVGILLLGVVPLPSVGGDWLNRLSRQAERAGLWGAGLLGILFALAFCPLSAALFFGSLIPLAIKHESPLLFPVLYGVGTALPAAGFAFVLAFAANRLSLAFQAVSRLEKIMRWLTAAVFLGVGLYYSLTYTLGLSVLW